MKTQALWGGSSFAGLLQVIWVAKWKKSNVTVCESFPWPCLVAVTACSRNLVLSKIKTPTYFFSGIERRNIASYNDSYVLQVQVVSCCHQGRARKAYINPSLDLIGSFTWGPQFLRGSTSCTNFARLSDSNRTTSAANVCLPRAASRFSKTPFAIESIRTSAGRDNELCCRRKFRS